MPNEKELEIEIVEISVELERQSALLARLSAEIEEISAGPPASGPQSSGGLKRSERDSQLIELLERGIQLGVGNQLRRPWTREALGTCEWCRHAHLTLAVSEEEVSFMGEGSGTMGEVDREPRVLCLVAHRELEQKVVWCASRQELEDEDADES